MSDQIWFTLARLTARANLHAGWLAGGTLVIYSEGSGIPGKDEAITDQTALVTFDMPDPAGDVSDGVFTADTIAAALIATTGTAAFARAYDSVGVGIGHYDIGVVGSGQAIELDNLSLTEGAYATVVSFVVMEG